MKTRFLIILFIFLTLKIFPTPTKSTICLNMIVKDEVNVIERSLGSVKNFIDYWVIVDTGSTDGTQDKIKEFMKDVPGELHEHEWVDFAYNRNIALNLAKNKADYLLILDADDQIVFSKDFTWPYLDKDSYFLKIKHGNIEHFRIQMIKNSLNWQWVGVLHEYIHSSEAKTSSKMENPYYLVNIGGARSHDPKKYEKDAEVLEKALKKEPNNPRYMFYLAQSYRDSNKLDLAIKNYQKRVSMKGWEEEVFFSLYTIALLQERMQLDPEIYLASFFKAFAYRPSRIEPLYAISNYYRRAYNYQLGYHFAKMASEIPYSKDILFVEDRIYKYGILLELSICAYWIEKYEESKKLSERILKLNDLPQNVRDVVVNNLKFANQKILEKQTNEIVIK